MLKKLLLPLAALIMLSSCSNKFSLTKRKYTKGYYFAHSVSNKHVQKNKEQKDVAFQNVEKKQVITEIVASTPLKINTTDNEIISYKKEVSKVISNPSLITNKSATTKLIASVSKTNAFKTQLKLFSKVIKPVIIGKKSGKGDSDINLILLVILSLFPILALVAIYLHDGKKITLNFWIDLILHFLFLYWLFALLVVLDVIDLR